MTPIIAYIRVSTQKQGRSGLGLEAQRDQLAKFALAEQYEIAAEYVEVESGAIPVNPGDTFLFTITRVSDGYASELGLLDCVGILFTGASSAP